MPRYFFDILANGERIDDPEGMELPDLKAARAEAIQAARDLMDDPIIANGPVEFEISDETGAVLLKLPFSEALSN